MTIDPELTKLSDLSTAPVKGMRDFLPDQTELRDTVLEKIIAVYRSYGFDRVETPMLEDIKRLRGGEGGENLQLIFQVLKRGEKLDLTKGNLSPQDLSDLGLRFDLTVPLVRYYAHNLALLSSPFKAIQVGPVWRAENPQKGRYRQFTQCDVDIIGQESIAAEVELLCVAFEAFRVIGINDVVLKINDRRLLAGIARKAGFTDEAQSGVFISLDKFDKIGLAGVEADLRKREYDANAIDQLVKMLDDYLSAKNRGTAYFRSKLDNLVESKVFEDLEFVANSLKAVFGLEIAEFDPLLVRGMGYYTGQIFEAQSKEFASGSVGGGGRYDKLVGKVLGKDVPACGFSIGFERIISVLEERKNSARFRKMALFYEPEKDSLELVIKLANEFRAQGKAVSMMERPKKMAAKLTSLIQHGFETFAVFQNEGKPDIRTLKE